MPEQTVVLRPNGLVINELFLNPDRTSLAAHRDPAGVTQPWLELYNGSGETIDLSAITLVGEGVEQARWAMPNLDLAAGAHLRIWGSGLDRTTASDDLHTGFPIMGSDVLSLLDADGSVIDRVEGIAFPRDETWGRVPDGGDEYAFYATPTPVAPNPASGHPFSLSCDDITLTAGASYQIEVSPSVALSWESSDSRVAVDSANRLTSSLSGVAGRDPTTITATGPTGQTRSCAVAVVNWEANRSELRIVGYPQANFLLGYYDNSAYFTQPQKLFRATDGFRSSTQIGSFPTSTSVPLMLRSANGYFASAGASLYSTQDFQSWARELTMRNRPLQHGFARYFDESNATEYLYAGEYSVDPNAPHAVYRGINTGPNTRWKKVLEWQPESAFYGDTSNLNTIRHVHAVQTDPYTGHVWVATGDLDQHSRLYFSDDNGESFTLIAIGSQKFRSLSLWFTERFVYWNMDTERADQKVYRIPRSVFASNGRWPSLTPELSSGSTRDGVRYLVSKTGGGYFPSGAGQFFVETAPRVLSAGERVYAIDDPQFDYSEEVADLTHSAQWNHLWVKDQRGEDVLIMTTSVESTPDRLRDFNSRVFGFKERADGSVDVQELLSLPANVRGVQVRYSQLIPNLQDDLGYIYLRGRETTRRIYQTRLRWVDNPGE